MSEAKIIGLKLYMLMLGQLITGSANTILMKVQDGTLSYDPIGRPGQGPFPFTHPYWQCAVMFAGEALCLVAYGIKCLWLRRKLALSKESGHLELIEE